MNLVSFDIESQLIPADWDRRDPLDITCACAEARLKGPVGVAWVHRMWYAGMSEGLRLTDVEDLAASIEGGNLSPKAAMNEEEVNLMLDELLAISRGTFQLDPVVEPQKAAIVGWNSMGFDFPVLVSNAPDRLDDVLEIANGSVDPVFQFIVEWGYPVSLAAIAEEMLGEGKFQGMTGKDAAKWPFDAARILRYVRQDATLTLDVIEAIMAERQVRWTSRSGNPVAKPLTAWHRVRKLLSVKQKKAIDDCFKVENLTDWMQAL